MKKIALVHSPYPRKGRSSLLGAGYIASVLHKDGQAPLILDDPCYSYNTGSKRMLKKIISARPDAVGFALTTSYSVYWAYDFLKQLKRAMPDKPYIAGGLHATLMPGEALRAGFDYVILGDGEETFIELLGRLETGTMPAGVLKGVARIDRDGTLISGGPVFLQNLDGAPFPANRFFVEFLYGKPLVTLMLLFSRGCFRTCAFCIERRLNRSVRYRSADNVMAEIEDAWERSRINRLNFLDSSFLEDGKRVEELCARMIDFKKRAALSWKCMARVDHVNAELLALLKEAGCDDIFFGMESANDDTLKRIKKNIKVSDSEQAAALCRDAGIRPHGYFMVGFPWETERHFSANEAFVKKHSEYLNSFFFIPVPYPGTQLYEEYHEQFGFTDWWVKEKPVPMAKPGRPLYRWLRSFDTYLERNFFRYEPAVWERLNGFSHYSEVEFGGGSMKKRLYRASLKILGNLSLVLEKISPAVEHAVMPPVYYFFQTAANLLRKPQNFGFATAEDVKELTGRSFKAKV